MAAFSHRWRCVSEDGSRWLLPLREHGASPQVYEPGTGALTPYTALTPGGDGAHPKVAHAFKMVIRTSGGALLAMGSGAPGKQTASEAIVLHKAADADEWTEVLGFPAGIECPAGVAQEEWDDDGDREDRFLLARQDKYVAVFLELHPHVQRKPIAVVAEECLPPLHEFDIDFGGWVHSTDLHELPASEMQVLQGLTFMGGTRRCTDCDFEPLDSSLDALPLQKAPK